MTLPADLIEAGYILKTHGYKGELKLALHFNIAFIKENEPVFLQIAGKPVPFFIEQIRNTDDDTAIIKLEDINDPDTARIYEKHVVLLSRRQIPPDIFSGDPEPGLLSGYTLLDETSGKSGQIMSINDSGIQDLLEVKLQSGEIVLVPFHPDLLVDIDEKKQTVTMILPEGGMEPL